ncbi:MAG: hypothetical protein V2I32_07155 [Desulforhopalus sp.]|jgi:hypothetical protein|nr:hypothetical protein [Desulforhopalus sp.]
MPASTELSNLAADVQHNCDISDARDHGIYSMCTMVLKLRNHYKWENGLQPWEEPEPGDLLDWIEGKENYWATLSTAQYRPLAAGGRSLEPLDLEEINAAVPNELLFYGAGYGRSLKTIFFLAEKLEQRPGPGCRVILLGREWAREMASPFAMVQDGAVIIRRESLRFFMWDQIQEVNSSCRTSLNHALRSYGVFSNGILDHRRLKTRLDSIVDQEMDLFIHHELGETRQDTLSTETLQKIIGHFPGTVVEFVSRAVKDIHADTHPDGLLAFLVEEQRQSSLGFYLAFLDALRSKLFPEITPAWRLFVADHDWRHIAQARHSCWQRNRAIAQQITAIAETIGEQSDQRVVARFAEEILRPLGLDPPQ